MLTHDERVQMAIKFNQERMSSRTAVQLSIRKMILEATLSPEEGAKLVGIFDPWRPGKAYKVGNIVSYHGILYEVIQAHTSQTDWAPDTVPALFKSRAPAGVIPEWQQPAGGHDAYNKGDKVTFKGLIYESTINANVWSPTGHPQGWKVVTQ